jgi:ATP-dependent Lhr-like helicase
VRPTRVAPITLFLRGEAHWLIPEIAPEHEALSHAARETLAAIERRGASFFNELVRATGRLPSEVEDALWELVAAGLVTADGFENLRALIDPKRRRGEGAGRRARPRHAAGRWALLHTAEPHRDDEAVARQFLARWGVVFRDLMARETIAPPWRDMLQVLRRLEDRGEVRGGRFVSGFAGEQFALPEAVDLLRVIRRRDAAPPPLVSAADPLNLSGILLPGARVSALSGATVRVGEPVAAV